MEFLGSCQLILLKEGPADKYIYINESVKCRVGNHSSEISRNPYMKSEGIYPSLCTVSKKQLAALSYLKQDLPLIRGLEADVQYSSSIITSFSRLLVRKRAIEIS